MTRPVPEPGAPDPSESPGPPGRSGTVRAALRSPAIPLVAAQVFAGVAAYGFLVLAGRTLGADAFAPVSVLWASLFLLGSGLFQPLEHEMSRRVAHQRELGQGTRSLVRTAARVGTVLVGVLVLLLLVAAPWAVPTLFDHQVLIYVGLVVGVPGVAASHFLKGVAAGQGRFGAYSTWFVAEGTTNLLPTVVLVLLGVTVAGCYGLVAGLAGVAGAVAISFVVPRDPEPGPPLRPADFASKVGQLMVASLLLAVLIGGGPVAVRLIAPPGQDAAVSRFLVALIIARIPIYFFQTVQAVVLPRLTRQAARHAYREFRRGLRLLAAGLLLCGAVTSLAAAVVGPFVIRTMFGPSFGQVSGTDLALLTAANFVLMTAMLVGQALIALQNQSRVWVGWATGVVAAAAVLTTGLTVFRRVELALLVGSTVALLTMWSIYFLTARAREQDSAVAGGPVPTDPG